MRPSRVISLNVSDPRVAPRHNLRFSFVFLPPLIHIHAYCVTEITMSFSVQAKLAKLLHRTLVDKWHVSTGRQRIRYYYSPAVMTAQPLNQNSMYGASNSGITESFVLAYSAERSRSFSYVSMKQRLLLGHNLGQVMLPFFVERWLRGHYWLTSKNMLYKFFYKRAFIPSCL
jgi:hypothetical protein